MKFSKKTLIWSCTILIIIIILYIFNGILGKEGFAAVKCSYPTPKLNGKKCVACPPDKPKWDATLIPKPKCVACPPDNPKWDGKKCVACPDYHYYDKKANDCLFGDKKCNEMMNTNSNTDYIYNPSTTICDKVVDVAAQCRNRCNPQITSYALYLNNNNNTDVCGTFQKDFKSKISCKSMD